MVELAHQQARQQQQQQQQQQGAGRARAVAGGGDEWGDSDTRAGANGAFKIVQPSRERTGAPRRSHAAVV